MADEYMVTEKPLMPPTHPGEILKDDVLPALNISVSEAARQLRVTRRLPRIISFNRGNEIPSPRQRRIE